MDDVVGDVGVVLEVFVWSGVVVWFGVWCWWLGVGNVWLLGVGVDMLYFVVGFGGIFCVNWFGGVVWGGYVLLMLFVMGVGYLDCVWLGFCGCLDYVGGWVVGGCWRFEWVFVCGVGWLVVWLCVVWGGYWLLYVVFD